MQKQKIFTDANLYDHEEFTIISESADQILGDLERKLQDEGITLPHDPDLVLEVVPWDEELVCGYYFVNHDSRCLFWLEEFDASGFCHNEIQAVVSLSHLSKL